MSTDTLYRIGKSYNPLMDDQDFLYDNPAMRSLTLEEAQAHCSLPTTRNPGVWFDFYTEDNET